MIWHRKHTRSPESLFLSTDNLNPSSQKRRKKSLGLFVYLLLSIILIGTHPLQGTEGVSLSSAQDAFSYSRSHGGTSLIIKQGNSIVLEKYTNGGSATRPTLAFSMTKSLCGLMAMAGDAEKVFSLDEKVSGTIHEWRKDPLKNQITVRQLLNQTSGLSTGYHVLYADRVKNKGKIAVQVNRLNSPGTTFLYGPSHWEVFEEFLQRKLKPRGTTPMVYLRQKVLIACGGRVSRWRMDGSGNPYFSTGAMLTARQLLKAGDLLLNSGRYGLVQLIPYRELMQLNLGTSANPMYSMGFWLNRSSASSTAQEVSIEQRIGGGYSASSWKNACISKRAPSDLIAMVGSQGQRVYMVPSRRLIIVRQGVGEKFRDSEFLRRLFH